MTKINGLHLRGGVKTLSVGSCSRREWLQSGVKSRLVCGVSAPFHRFCRGSASAGGWVASIHKDVSLEVVMSLRVH